MRMNKFLSRGLIITVLGILIGILGSFLQREEYGIYKWVLILSVIVFGIGFLTIVYSLIRKIERKSILQERTEQQNETDETP
jgi:cytochrome c biogenesis protein CcdA